MRFNSNLVQLKVGAFRDIESAQASFNSNLVQLNSNSATKYGIGVSFVASKGRNRLRYGLFEEKSWKKLAQMQNYMDLSYSVNTVKRFAIWQLIQNGLPPTDKKEQRSALSRANIMFMQSVVNGILKRKDLKK